MKISVIVPAYNEEKFIKPCLEAVKKQTVPAWEIVVVNNNSKDNTENIAKCVEGIKLIRERKQGLIYARDAGFNYSTGEIMARIDADTVIPPDWIKKVEQAFLDPEVVGVSGPVVFHDFYGGEVAGRILGRVQQFLHFGVAKFFSGHDIMFGSNMAIRRSAWLKIKDETCKDDKVYHEDMDLSFHLHPEGKIVFHPELVAYISARRVKAFHTLFDYLVRQIRGIIHSKKLAKQRRLKYEKK